MLILPRFLPHPPRRHESGRSRPAHANTGASSKQHAPTLADRVDITSPKRQFAQTQAPAPSTTHKTVILFGPLHPTQTRAPVPGTGFPGSSTNRTHMLPPGRRVRGLRRLAHWDAGEVVRFWQRRRPKKPGPLDPHSKTKSHGRQAPGHRCQWSGSCRTWRRLWRGLRVRPTTVRMP